MRDYPPLVTAFSGGRTGRPADEPDTRSPGAFLRWLLRRQPEVIASATVVGVLWQLPLTVGPWMFGRAVDEGILPGSVSQTLYWAGLLLLVTLVGAVFGIAMHTLVVRSWLIGIYGTDAAGHPQDRADGARAAAADARPGRCSAWPRATPTSSARSPRSWPAPRRSWSPT